MTELVVEERERTNRPRAYLIKCMDGILSPPLVFLRDRPASKLNITRVCVLSVLLNMRVHVRTRTAEEAFT